MQLELNDAAILGAAPIIRKVVDALLYTFPSLKRYKLFVSGVLAGFVVGIKALPEPYQMYIKLTLALMFATAFYNDWYKSKKTSINVENVENVSVVDKPSEEGI